MKIFNQLSVDEMAQSGKEVSRLEAYVEAKYTLEPELMYMALGAGCLGALADLFLFTNVNTLSNAYKIGFKPESAIRHLRKSGYINKQVYKLTRWFNESWVAELLESICHVPYDRVKGTRILGMKSYTHRLLTPGHDPLLGFWYGVRDIMNSTMTVTDNNADTYVLNCRYGQHSNLIVAILYQLGHILSDAGSYTSIPFPGLYWITSLKGKSPINNMTWTRLAKTMYLKGFTIEHLIGSSIPVMMADIILQVMVEIYIHVQMQDKKEVLLLDDEVKARKLAIMRSVAYGMMVTANITKIAITHGNLFAVNPCVYVAFLKNGVTVAKDQLFNDKEKERHELIMDTYGKRLARASENLYSLATIDNRCKTNKIKKNE